MDIKRFKQLREQNRLTQKEFAEKIGVSSSTVAMWERGERDPDTNTLALICDILDCTGDFLLGRVKHRHGEILEGTKLPPELQGKDIQLGVIKTINDSGLTEKQIKHALWLYKLYTEKNNDDQQH